MRSADRQNCLSSVSLTPPSKGILALAGRGPACLEEPCNGLRCSVTPILTFAESSAEKMHAIGWACKKLALWSCHCCCLWLQAGAFAGDMAKPFKWVWEVEGYTFYTPRRPRISHESFYTNLNFLEDYTRLHHVNFKLLRDAPRPS